MMDEMI